MSGYKLTNLLRLLKREEVERLGSYLLLAGAGEDCTTLYRQLRPQHPHYRQEKVAEAKAFAQHHPGKAQDDGAVRRLRHRLVEWVKSFLAWQEFEQNRQDKEIFMLQAFARRQPLHPLFEELGGKLVKQLEEKASTDSQAALRMHQVHAALLFHPSAEKFSATTWQVEEAARWLDLHHLLARLKLLCELSTKERLLKVTCNGAAWRQQTLELAAGDPARENPLVQIFVRLALLCEPKASPDLFFEAKALLENCRPLLQAGDVQFLMTQLQNHAYWFYKCGEAGWMEEVWKLTKLSVDWEVVMQDGHMADMTFLNAVTVACTVGQVAWARDFAQRYKGFLDPASQKDLTLVAGAYADFETGEFDKAQVALGKVRSKNTSGKVYYRVLDLRVLYELQDRPGNDGLLDSRLHAYELFVRRDKQLSEPNARSYLNFANLVQKLLRLRLEAPKARRQKKQGLAGEIEAASTVAKSWLLEKASQL